MLHNLSMSKKLNKQRNHSVGSIEEYLKRKRSETEKEIETKNQLEAYKRSNEIKTYSELETDTDKGNTEKQSNMDKLISMMEDTSKEIIDVKNEIKRSRCDIKTNNEEMKKLREEINTIKEKFNKKEAEWEQEKVDLKSKIMGLENRIETQERKKKINNIVIKGLELGNENIECSSDLKCKLAKFSHKKSINKESSTQTVYSTVNSSKTVNSLTKVTNNKVTTKINDHFLGADVVGAARFDKFSQTAVNMRNNTAQTHTSPIVNNFEETNSTKIGNKQRVVHETRINIIQSNKSLLEELKEIYPPVQLNLDSSLGSTASKYDPKMCITRKEKHIKILTQKAKIRILILADSHGRNLVSKFRDRLSPKYSVQCIFKPNATFEQITCDLSGLTLDFNKDDQVIIITGTNNALNKNYISDHHIEKAVAALSHTNCLFAAVPYAYHYNYNYFNNLAYKTNYQFQFIVNRYCGFAKFLDVNRILNSSHKTLNGLHLNDKVRFNPFLT
ncbi:hypothetical protein FQR65_LT18016 [Abscondita terminalis]|nr:hypothetical protein FQR65_LT18016 [Abscondita terminalis]